LYEANSMQQVANSRQQASCVAGSRLLAAVSKYHVPGGRQQSSDSRKQVQVVENRHQVIDSRQWVSERRQHSNRLSIKIWVGNFSFLSDTQGKSLLSKKLHLVKCGLNILSISFSTGS